MTKVARNLGLATVAVAAALVVPFIAGSQQAVAEKKTVAAKKLFGAKKRAANLPARAIGFYSRGCLAGGMRLEPTGPNWQAMRLSRNRNWAHPNLIKLIKTLAKDAKEKDGYNGLMVGDLTQPRGGPMTSGHSSHQVGLDADIWLREMPNKVLPIKRRETFPPISMLKNSLEVNPKAFTEKIFKLIRRAASYPQVERIGVNPAIKYALCKKAGGDKPWLGKIQGWAGHHYHMHIRIKCPPGSTGCRAQGAPKGTSCAVATKWYKDTKAWIDLPKAEKQRRIKAKKKRAKPKKKKRNLMMADLPDACRDVLQAGENKQTFSDLIEPPLRKPRRYEFVNPVGALRQTQRAQ